MKSIINAMNENTVDKKTTSIREIFGLNSDTNRYPLIIKGHIKIKAVKRIYEPGYRKSFSTNPIN